MMGFQITQCKMMEFMVDVVYCNTLRWDEVGFVEVESTIFANASLVPVLNITPGLHTRMK